MYIIFLNSFSGLPLVAFDEDFEAEVAENHDAKNEVSLLSKSFDPELTEVSYDNCKSFHTIYSSQMMYSILEMKG